MENYRGRNSVGGRHLPAPSEEAINGVFAESKQEPPGLFPYQQKS